MTEGSSSSSNRSSPIPHIEPFPPMVENPAQMSNGLYDFVDRLAELGIAVEFVSDEGAAEGSGPGDAEMVPLEDVLNVILGQSAGEDIQEPLLALESGESDMPILLPTNFLSSPTMSTSGDSTQRARIVSSSDGNRTGSGSTSSGIGSRAKRAAPEKSDGSTGSGSTMSGKGKPKKVDPKNSEKKTRKTRDTKKKPGKLNKKPARGPKKKKDGDAK